MLNRITISIFCLLLIPSMLLCQDSEKKQKFFPANPERAIEDQYIVVLKREAPFGGRTVETRIDELTRRFGGEAIKIWKSALEGFLARMTERQARGVSNSSLVVAVIQDNLTPWTEVTSNSTPYCFPEDPTGCSPPDEWVVNTRSFSGFPQSISCDEPDPGASGCIDNWGLDLLDGAADRDGSFSVPLQGEESHVYVIDTGVGSDHVEFGARVSGGYNATLDGFPATDDYIGHGTHVAGIIGSSMFGVAKRVNIHPIRVVNSDCRQPQSAVDEALNWVAANHDVSLGTAIVNLSMNNPDWGTGDSFVDLRTAAIGVASRQDLLLVQSAGNGDADACAWGFGDEDSYAFGSPEYEATNRVLLVGGSDENNGRWMCDSIDSNCGSFLNSGSNTGPCVDMFAPAAHVVSTFFETTYITSDMEMAMCRSSGTSMAAPHVAGLGALLLEQEPLLSAGELRSRILGTSMRGVLQEDSQHRNYIGAGSPNRLIHFDPTRLIHDSFESGDLEIWSATNPAQGSN